ncbi:TonB-linked outer membrane protein, SusC/RagA family [Chitinophaga eiseniae]|uniref:TonB-linked outer membrane protein, SusC/RagA family n=1 Tax=Chitinophaga eiseniae TaxID=634771 RepID=A0A1T4TCV0_9BACT|nr:SusC/RagA family TonB-linked outer membrane protein [Chitinophaga eiseniae]SKA38039.1 TonB-linked outer membrane protein, SusC/RagA family [Chitinophaga eiseniae]
MPELRRPKRYIPWKQLGLLLLIAAIGLPLTGLSQTMNYSSKKVTLQQVFAEIKKQTDHVVVFNPEQVDVTQTVPVNARNQPLEAFMRALLAKTPLNFTIVGTTIVIFRKADVAPEYNMPPPPVEIMGIVYDEKTVQPIPGVSVFASVSGKGVQTNEKGFFSLKNLKDAEMLTFSSIGYEKVTMAAGQPGVTMYVKMKVATSELDQAVVQGYGVTSKRLATGSITKVTGTEIASQPVMNPLQALQGRVPGLLVTQTSGYASSPLKLEIRGRNSLGKGFLSDPLYIIDGVPLTVLNLVNVTEGVSSGFVQGGFSAAGGQSPLFGLNAKDIESIEVLKDADATAIYGSRGANGVILITTKRGKTGKTALSVDVREGIVTVPRQWHLLDTKEYLQMRRDAFKNEGIAPTIATAPDLMLWDTTRYTNWQKEILGTGKMTNVSASLSGGDNQNTFYVSANYGRQVELLSKSGASQKASVMSRVRHASANQKFSIMVGTTIGYTKVDAIVNMGDAAYLPPNAPPIYDSKGNLNFAEWTAHNPVSQFPFESLGRKNISQATQLDGNMELRYEIAKGLTFSTTGGYSFVSGTSDNFVPMASQNPALNPTGMAIFGTTRNTNWIVEPQLAYTRFIGKGDLSIQAGTSYQSAATNGTTVFGFGYGDDALLGSISNAPLQQATEMLSRYKYAAVFGRISYNWDNKYILNLNARRDGSSRFAPGRQYGNFGSVGMGWIMSEEPWVKAVLPSWVTFLKLRGSYGITGGDGSIGDYQYLSQWGTRTIGGLLGKYDGVQPYVPIHAMNQDYHWEANKKMEGSLSVSFLNDRINLEVLHYRNRTGDQVTGLPTPQYTGFSSVLANWAAVVQNSGWEGMIRANLVRQKDFSWTVSFNISRNRNVLVAYPDLEFSPYYGTYKVGQSLSTRYYLHYVGIDPQTGKHAFDDYNKDGQATVNLGIPDGTGMDDRYVPIDDAPKYYGGFGSQFTWKGVRLDLFFDYKKQLGPDPFANILPGAMTNLPREALANHWTKPGDNAKYAGFAPIGYTLFNASDGAFMDASYVRLRSLAVSYDFPEKLVKKARMESFRLYIQTENIFNITRYTGLDPDTRSLTALPSPRTITGGVMLNF